MALQTTTLVDVDQVASGPIGAEIPAEVATANRILPQSWRDHFDVGVIESYSGDESRQQDGLATGLSLRLSMNQRVARLGQLLRRSLTGGNTRQLARPIQRRDDLAILSPTGAPPTRSNHTNLMGAPPRTEIFFSFPGW